MKKIQILFLLFLSILISKPAYFSKTIVDANPVELNESKIEKQNKLSNSNKFKGFLEAALKSALSLQDIPAELKNSLNDLKYDSPVFNFKHKFPNNLGQLSLKINLNFDWTSDNGISPGKIIFSSPAIKDLMGYFPSLQSIVGIVSSLGEIRFLNLILGVNLNPIERDILKNIRENPNKTSVLKKLIDQLKQDEFVKHIQPFAKFFIIENGVIYLKPVQVALIKFALLLKALQKKKIDKKELFGKLTLLFYKLSNSIAVDETLALPENKGKMLSECKVTVKMDDPEVLIKLMPPFIKEFIDTLPLNVSLEHYIEFKDGFSDYLSNLSEIWRRGSVDSKIYFLNRDISPEFSDISTITEIRKTSLVFATLCENIYNAKDVNIAKKYLISDLDDFIKSINSVHVSSTLTSDIRSKLTTWKVNIASYFLKLKNKILSQTNLDSTKIDIDFSNFVIKQDIKLSLKEFISYYKEMADNILNAKHIVEPGFILDYSALDINSALRRLLGITYRLNKDVNVATKSSKGIKIRKERLGGIMRELQVKRNLVIKANRKLNLESKTSPGYLKAKSNYDAASKEYSRVANKYKQELIDYKWFVAQNLKISFKLQDGQILENTPYAMFIQDFKFLSLRFRKVKDLLNEVLMILGLPYLDEIEEDIKDKKIDLDEEFNFEDLDGIEFME